MLIEIMFPDELQLRVDGVELEEGRMVISVTAISEESICPHCGTSSERIHSSYQRHPADLSLAGYTVCLDITVPRFFCDNKGGTDARVIKRANILLLSDQGKTAPEIAEFIHTSENTVYNIRKRFTNDGLESALYEKPRPGAKPKFQPEQEAYLIVLACSEPPDGRERWTLRMLTNKVVELGILDRVGRETVRCTLKKTFSSPGRRSSGASPE